MCAAYYECKFFWVFSRVPSLFIGRRLKGTGDGVVHVLTCPYLPAARCCDASWVMPAFSTALNQQQSVKSERISPRNDRSDASRQKARAFGRVVTCCHTDTWRVFNKFYTIHNEIHQFLLKWASCPCMDAWVRFKCLC